MSNIVTGEKEFFKEIGQIKYEGQVMSLTLKAVNRNTWKI